MIEYDDTANGADILDELHEAIGNYVIMPSAEAHDAVTCYIAATHAIPAWEHATRLAIISPEKRCGKSRLLDVIEATCHNPMIGINISPAALARELGKNPPTVLLDEADTVFGNKPGETKEDLRGILNAGHQRNRPYIRYDVTTRTNERLETFGMAVLAGIGDLPDTIMDRSVIIRMRRRARHEKVKPFRHRRDEPLLRLIGGRLNRWLEPHVSYLMIQEPEMPVEDRAADTWEPLVAIADAAGGEWPTRIRIACERMVADADELSVGTSYAQQLLADLKTVFGSSHHNLYTATILNQLHKLEDSPWNNYYGRQLNPNDMAKLLKDYGVRPKNVREPDGPSAKGYCRDDLYQAWERYLPDVTDGNDDRKGDSLW